LRPKEIKERYEFLLSLLSAFIPQSKLWRILDGILFTSYLPKELILPGRWVDMEINAEELSPDALYRTVLSTVVPRPIGWISSKSPEGVDNLAPYSFFNAVSHSPPVLMFSADQNDGEMKDTPRNVLESGEFVWNLVTEDVAEAMDATSTTLSADQSEFEFAGLERASSAVVAPPRVAEADVAFECKLYDSMDVYENTVIFGEVQYAHVNDDLLVEGKVEARKVDAVGRLGGPYFSAVDIMDIERSH